MRALMNDCPRENCLVNERGKIERTEKGKEPIYDDLGNYVNHVQVTKQFYSCGACGCEWYVATDGMRTWTEMLAERRVV